MQSHCQDWVSARMALITNDALPIVYLQLHYDSAPVHIGSLDSSVWVFALLGAFYAVLGALFVFLDGLVERGVVLQGEEFMVRMASGAAIPRTMSQFELGTQH